MARDAYRDCRLCPRDCGANRAEGGTGRCGETAQCRVASIGPHFGEEPSFSGTRGSGTVFFTGCSSGCCFCQNHQISFGRIGRVTTPSALLRAAESLIERGVHNLNFVTPDHFWPHVRALCGALRERGHGLPFLFNGSGYHREDLVAEYAGPMDLFLPDFKFADPALAARCMGDARYPAIALAALRRMVERRGFLDPWDPSGREPARRGVLVRHLVLPGEAANSVAVLRLLHRAFGDQLPLSVMSQFHPVPACAEQGLFTRRVRPDEYQTVLDEVETLGFERVYLQDLPDGRAFLPDFRREEPFEGNREGRAPS